MDKAINMLFTNEKSYYTDKNELIIWNYFIPKDLDDCISFVTIYQPEMILLDTSVDNNTISECIFKIKHSYTYSPIIIFAQKEQIINMIINDLLPTVKSRNIIEIPIEVEKKLDYALVDLNFTPALKGYNFIKRCLFEGMCNPTIFENIEKNLYTKVAEVYLTTKYSIERAINFSIKRAFSENPASFDKYINISNSPPSNGKFLKTLLILKYLENIPRMGNVSDFAYDENDRTMRESRIFRL